MLSFSYSVVSNPHFPLQQVSGNSILGDLLTVYHARLLIRNVCFVLQIQSLSLSWIPSRKRNRTFPSF